MVYWSVNADGCSVVRCDGQAGEAGTPLGIGRIGTVRIVAAVSVTTCSVVPVNGDPSSGLDLGAMRCSFASSPAESAVSAVVPASRGCVGAATVDVSLQLSLTVPFPGEARPVGEVSGTGCGAGALRASGKLSLLHGVLIEWQRE